MKIKTLYYTDPLNDDFAGTGIKPEKIPADYKYSNESVPYRICKYFIYNFIGRPVVFIASKVWYRQKFVNRRSIKDIGNNGAFIYSNHTMMAGDAFIPNIVCPKYNYIVVGPDAVSIRGIKWLVKLFGAVPVPSSAKGFGSFYKAIKDDVEKGSTVTIYPEAHIWPYYTGIRPFKDVSFSYPVKFNSPVYVMTNTFSKRKFSLSRRPKVTTYIDGPVYPDLSMCRRDAVKDLRDRVFEIMSKRAEKSDYEYIRYVYAGYKTDDPEQNVQKSN